MNIKQVVRAFVFNDKNDILMVKHHEDGRWVLPWGHIETWESLYDTLRREIKEEFNLYVEPFWEVVWTELKGIDEYPVPVSIYTINYVSHKHWSVTKMEYIFMADVVWWKFNVDKGEIFNYRWFSINQLLELDPVTETFPQIIDILKKNLDLIK